MDQLIKVDDLDNRSVDGVERLEFGYRGVDYEIDLTPEHRTALDELLRPYLTAGRRKQRGAAGPRKPRAASSPRGNSQDQRIRAWAAEKGIDLPPRGPLSQEVRDRFELDQAQPEPQAAAMTNPYAGAVNGSVQ